jgi:tetratricopeptide (TPR) repeat protein
MKKLLLGILSILNVLSIQAQTQKGLVRLQSSGRKTVDGVQILYSDAKATMSDANGVFRLTFAGKKPGDLIFLEKIHKEGYEVVNAKELEISKISSDEYLQKDIVLAISGTLEAAKREYYRISDNALTASFEREKQALKAQLQQIKVSQQQYLKKYEELEQRYENQKKNLDALAEKFARTNFDDVSGFYRESLELFKAGKVEEAIKKLEGANLMAEADKVIKEEKRLAILKQELAEQKAQTQIQKKQTIQALELNADIYVLRYETAKAGAIYEQLLRLDSTNLEVIQKVAKFYKDNHFYEKALSFYNKILTFPDINEPEAAEAYLAIGQLNTVLGKLKPEGLDFMNKSLKLYKKIVREDNAYYYQQRLALAYEGLADVHIALGNYLNSSIYYEKVIYILEKLYTANPTNKEFKKNLALAYQKIGDLRASTRVGFSESFSDLELISANKNYSEKVEQERFFLAELYKKLESAETEKSETEIKKSEELKNTWNWEKRRVDKPNDSLNTGKKKRQGKWVLVNAAKTYNQERLDSIKQLKSDVMERLNYLKNDTIYKNEYYDKMHTLLKELYLRSPQNIEYKNQFALSYSRLGNTYMFSKQWQMALDEYKRSQQVQKNLHEEYPNKMEFKKSLALAYSNMGAAYIHLDSVDKALSLYQKRLDLAKELYETNPENLKIKTNLALSYAHLGILFKEKIKEPDKPKALSYLQEAQKILIAIKRDAPEYAPIFKFLESISFKIGNLLHRDFLELGMWRKNETPTYFDGWVMTKDGNKLSGSILYDNNNKNQEEIKFKNKEGLETIYKAKDGEIIALEYDNKRFELVSIETSKKKKPNWLFLRLEFAGNFIKTYHYYKNSLPFARSGENFDEQKTQRILKKKDEPVLFQTELLFKQRLIKYLADCPELINDIRGYPLGFEDNDLNLFLNWYEFYRQTQQ